MADNAQPIVHAQRIPDATRPLPPPDALKGLKRKSPRAWSKGKSCETRDISVTLKVVTPILGGSYKLRHIDDIDIIRPQSVRAHLRFWWRALYAYKTEYDTPQKLYEAESSLWGRAADEKGGRSPVEIRVDVIERGEDDSSDIALYGRNETPGAYALWPAKAQQQDRRRNRPHIPTAPRLGGTRFRLTLFGPKENLPALKNVLRAWVLFGGYGSRTRRGLGSLTVEDNDVASWLPTTDLKAPNGARLSLDKALRASLEQLLSEDVFGQTGGACETPVLAGAVFHVLPPIAGAEKEAEKAWMAALGWLREFRQGPPGGQNGSARQRGNGRPGISNWPEADKIRHHTPLPHGASWPHLPNRHNSVAALPRAGFGLPIVGKFNTPGDPGDFEIAWKIGSAEKNRLASPLILKALPLADGRFAPCALWFNRARPNGAKVYVKGLSGTDCDFDVLEAPGDPARGIAKDVAQFPALQGHISLQSAFFRWLASTKRTARVA